MMDYNTTRNLLHFQEYGRNVQRMIEYAIQEPDKAVRNDLAKGIIGIMGQLNPHVKGVDNYEHNLWDHLHIMAQNKLDIDSPFPQPSLEQVIHKVKPIPYPKNKIKKRHYGKNMERLVEKITQETHPEKQKEFAENTAAFMKMINRNYHADMVSNEVILQDFEQLASGKVTVSAEADLDVLTKNVRQSASSKQKHNNRNSNNKNKNKRYSKSNYKKRY